MIAALRLVLPSLAYRESYWSFYEEWKETGEEMVPWVIEKDPSDFAEYVNFLYSQNTEEKVAGLDWVPHSTYWLVDSSDSVLGAVNIRHRLNEKLLNAGGHIGYGIRPSQRRRGHASTMLALALDKTRELGLDRVLVVCDHGNVGSERTILKNGGVFESVFVEENGNAVKRFWIPLAETGKAPD
ncbi:GNAT family N-acetyltransferase [Paenibacillus flagellatus]|uniref:GNAT family N-acetyltransferase n=1 Tax=Paenibacillus flagellatus TaxID=2211139 RepID=A0A2V5K4C5_9BACL|nr:GNAT family N-acetyltransferase [Paenibacillus flagellatus]PYI53582.1 GNAT family N-acetyltransferase [Paenibacillus flagellatus]